MIADCFINLLWLLNHQSPIADRQSVSVGQFTVRIRIFCLGVVWSIFISKPKNNQALAYSWENFFLSRGEAEVSQARNN